MEKLNRIEALLSMLQTEPKDVFLNYSLALEYMSNNSLDLAEEQLEKVIAIKNDYVPAYYQIGKLYEQLRQIEKARTSYNKGLELAKVQRNNRAVNEFGEAIFMLED